MKFLTDIQTELDSFFNELNWTYILIYSCVLYGIKHKDEFEWYNKLLDKNASIKPFKIWIAGLFIITLFSFFKYLENGFTSVYVSTLLRSWIMTIIFNTVATKKIKEIDN